MTRGSFAEDFLSHVVAICAALDRIRIEAMAVGIARIRERGGRLFILGVGGSAANAGHAVNDFRKLCNVEAYAPTDNVSELTARTNDEGWETVFSSWLAGSRANEKDGVLVFSVGGGNAEKNVSLNLVRALIYAREQGLGIYGVVGRDGGATAQFADVAVIVPTPAAELVTPLAESFQAIIWHCLVSHPALKQNASKW